VITGWVSTSESDNGIGTRTSTHTRISCHEIDKAYPLVFAQEQFTPSSPAVVPGGGGGIQPCQEEVLRFLCRSGTRSDHP